MLVLRFARLQRGCRQSAACLPLCMRMAVRLDPSRVCGQMMYARWNGDTGTFEQETDSELQLLPVSKRLQQTWREAYRAGRCRDIEWEWKQPGSMPGAEDAGDDVAQVYDEVRAAIKLGETMFPRGATSTDKAMHSYHSGWKETYGVYQTNTALRDGHQTEYEAFFGPDVADGLQEAWRRPMHWAGFLVMGASTRLPGPAARPQDDISTIAEWLRSIALQDYAAAIKEYGYDSFQALDAASEEQILEMTQDPDVAMKKPHRHLFLVEWKKHTAE